MSIAQVRAGLETRLVSVPGGIPAAQTAFENVSFIPTQGVNYQTVTLAPSPPENPTFGDGYYRENGIFRVRLYFQNSLGVNATQIAAEKIRDWFKRGTSVVSGGIITTVLRTPDISMGMLIDDRYSLTINIRYFASVFAP